MNQSVPAIRINNLKKNYGRVQALRGVNQEVRQGEIFGFLGPNGAGKTTTIRCMLDLIRPNGGSIEILGQNPQKSPAGLRPPDRLFAGRAGSGRQPDRQRATSRR